MYNNGINTIEIKQYIFRNIDHEINNLCDGRNTIQTNKINIIRTTSIDWTFNDNTRNDILSYCLPITICKPIKIEHKPMIFWVTALVDDSSVLMFFSRNLYKFHF